MDVRGILHLLRAEDRVSEYCCIVAGCWWVGSRYLMDLNMFVMNNIIMVRMKGGMFMQLLER